MNGAKNVIFLDATYRKVGRDIFKRLQFCADAYTKDDWKIGFAQTHVKEEYLYVEFVLTLPNGRQFECPQGVELTEVLLEGHKPADVAEFVFNQVVEHFQNALDFFGDNFEPEYEDE